MSRAVADKKKPKKEESTWNVQVGRWLYRPPVLILMAMICSAPIVYGYISKYLPEIGNLQQYQITADQIVVEHAPDYLPSSFTSDVIEHAGLKFPLSLWEPKLAEKLAQSAKAHPWTDKVNKITVSPHAGIRLDLVFRIPVALVKTNSGYYPVDRDGTLLPPRDFNPELISSYPLISNVMTIPQGPEGTNWGDLSVTGAARLAEFMTPNGDLNKYWKTLGFQEIMIPRLDHAVIEIADVEYRLKTRGGSEILWGLSPGVKTTQQPTAEQKLLKLLKYYEDFGSFEAPRGPYEIDFRHWTETYRRPLINAQELSGKSAAGKSR
jgi:hypothetical protein